MKHILLLILFGLMLLSFSACGESDEGADSDGDGADGDGADGDVEQVDGDSIDGDLSGWTPPAGTHLQWVYEMQAGSVCANGEPTGMGMNLNGDNRRVLIYLKGGGACWDARSCYGSLPLANFVESGYAEEEFEAEIAKDREIYLFPRDVPENPFAEDNFFYVSYCTGDLHNGDRVVDYGTEEEPRPTHHQGRANLERAISRIRKLIPNPSRVVLAGGSAGGWGSLLAFPLVAEAYPGAPLFLINDSGPFLRPPYMSSELHGNWVNYWKLGAVLPPDCPECQGDLSQLFAYLPRRYPGVRMAFLSYIQDFVLPIYFGIGMQKYTEGLADLTDAYFKPGDGFKYFYVDDAEHVVSMRKAAESDGRLLFDWLRDMLEGDAGWKSVDGGLE